MSHIIKTKTIQATKIKKDKSQGDQSRMLKLEEAMTILIISNSNTRNPA